MGRDAALLFSEEGASVCVADVDGEAAEETARDCLEAFAIRVDVADDQSVQDMYAATADRYGGIDVLYNNAASRPPTTPPSSTRSRSRGTGSST